jgi:type II secretory pathway pseudopilin PulG
MLARARAESGFTTIELLLAIMIASVGILSLVGTFDVSRRLTNYSEMKEAASHVAEQKMEELRAVDYGKLALNGDPSPASSTNANNPAHYLGSSGTAKTYKWDQKAGSTAAAEPLVIDAANGTVPAVAEAWSDGRIRGKVYRYVTCVATAASACDEGPDTSSYKRVTIAVTVENSLGPQKAILMSTLVGAPNAGNSNPAISPNTSCGDSDGDCVTTIPGTVRTWYLYDTPATSSARQEISGNHSTHATVAPSGTCTAATTTGCPVPDLMALEPPPAPVVTPPLYNYSSEITGGTTPGGAVIRRDAECSGSVTTTDNTKGHLWVSAPLAAPITLTGDAALSITTQTFNGVAAAGMLCVRFYNVPGDATNLVANPPTALGSAGHSLTQWARNPSTLAFAVKFLDDSAGAAIPAGNRIGVRVWAAASSAADLVVVYDHPTYPSFVQINEKE